MNIKKISITVSSLFLATTLSAQWKLVDNFETDSTASWVVTHGDNFVAPNIPAVQIVDDPFDAGQGKVAHIYPGEHSDGGGLSTGYALPLGAGLQIADKFPAAANTGTLYMKVLQPLVAGVPGITNLTFGMTASAATPMPEPATWSWGQYSVLARIAQNKLDWHSGTGYNDMDTAGASPATVAPVSNTFYEVWFVVNRTAQTIDGYIKGGQWATQTKVWSDAGPRTNPNASPLDHIYLRTSNGGVTDVDGAYIDDIYIDNSGTANLTTPGPGGSGGTTAPIVGSGQMSNISTRSFAGTGDQVMTGGFVVTDDQRRVLIRGVGPTLGGFGVAGTLADPVLTLRKSGETAVLFTNDNWGDAANAAEITSRATALGAFALPAGSKDAVILETLPKGAYTVQVTGADGGTGVAIIEVYRVQ